MSSLFLVAGDPSGDVHGAALMKALSQENPSLRLSAVGGPLMRQEADEFLEDLASLGVSGFLEPILRVPMLFKLRRRIQRHWAAQHPEAVVCIDYYGFNRWVLEAAREAGIPAYYYVSPQVWASRPGRIGVLRRLVKRMLVIFPFEEKLYRENGVPATFIGHPLLDRLPEPVEPNPEGRPLKIGLLPGSRTSEVRRHLPLFLNAVELLKEQYPSLQFYVFAAPSLPDSFYSEAARQGGKVLRESDYSERSKLDLIFSSSGTATLENALLGIPMIVVYRMSWPTYWIARSLIRVPYVSMANLLAGKALVPELIQGAATPSRIAQEASALLKNPAGMLRLRQDLSSLRSLLGKPGAASRGARIILEELKLAGPVAAPGGIHP